MQTIRGGEGQSKDTSMAEPKNDVEINNEPIKKLNSTEIKKQWYVVHAFSGMEKTVSRNLEERVSQAGMAELFGRILVPVEEDVEMKN